MVSHGVNINAVYAFQFCFLKSNKSNIKRAAIGAMASDRQKQKLRFKHPCPEI